ncbi:pilus assembly protein PilM [Metabacillus sp. GX 13764]|uniref:type IV pilus biogenesis protein PilM n=1 Tax=Metabacillus kandeliae TaxID=2900151 RepID=UPI001E4F9E84|nr:pilus assembly protein PilM [Metabacillus kandeliae]MCD7032913.1 pilus assembly protein PilM [Metabacillus kandeliae]
MNLPFFRSQNSFSNILITDYAIQFLELRSANPLVVQRFGEHFLPAGIVVNGKIIDQDKLSLIMDECIQEWSLKRKNIRFVVPDAFVIIKKITIPSDIKNDEIKGYLYLELGSNIHLPFEEPVFDYQVIGSSEGEREAILFAAPEQEVKNYADFFESRKLKLSAADISPLCGFRVLSDLKSAHENILFVQIDMKSVTFTIFEKEQPILMRNLPVAQQLKNWEHQTDQLTGQYFQFSLKDESKEEALLLYEDSLGEIEKLLGFYKFSVSQGEQEIGKIVIAGDHPFLPDFFEKISSITNLPVIPLRREQVETSKNGPLPEKFKVLLGLALKEVE